MSEVTFAPPPALLLLRRRILFAFLLFLLLGARLFADVGSMWLDVNLGTIHSNSNYYWNGELHRYNQTNFGLGVTYQSHTYLSVKAGWFENSYEKTSVYALLNPEFTALNWRRLKLKPGVAAGLVTGYDDTPEDASEVAPWGIITLGVEYDDRWRLNIGYLPSSLVFDGGTDVGIAQLSYHF